MEPIWRKLYLNEVRLQADNALDAFNELTTLRGPYEEPFFRAAHAFATYAANVSFLLWPTTPVRDRDGGEDRNAFEARKTYARERGRELRRLLYMPENRTDHILGNRELRNTFEHFDLAIDRFLVERNPQFFADKIVKPDLASYDIPPDLRIRALSMTDLEFHFFGRRFPLTPLMLALTEIRRTADDVLKSAEIYR